MAKRIKILGAALVTPEGITLTGDLGIEKDIDIVAAMFSAVSAFVEDTFERPAEQIRLGGDLFVTRVAGKHVILWVTSTGTSEELIEHSRILLEENIESLYFKDLEAWGGSMDDPWLKELKGDFEKRLKGLEKKAGKEEELEVSQPGFDILKREDVHLYINELEDAFNGYFLLGDHDSAFELASKAAQTLELRDKNTKDSSLFYALAARAIVEKRKPKESKKWLDKARETAKKQENMVAMAETANAFAMFYVWEKETGKALKMAQEAKNFMREVDVGTASNYVRLLDFKLTEVLAHAVAGNHNEAIKYWKNLLGYLKKFPDDATEIDKTMLIKQEIKINNNIATALILRDRLDPRNYEKAIPYYKISIKRIRETDAKSFSATNKSNLAQAYAFTGKIKKADELLEEAMEDAKELKNEYQIAFVERVYGIVHYAIGMKNKDPEELYDAMHWFKKALKHQKDQHEIDGINFFKNETQKALKKML